MFYDYLRLAFRNLSRRRLRSWLTMIGIIIGITAVVSLIGMGQGLRVAIMSQFGDLGTDKLTVTATGGMGPPGTAVVNPLTQDNVDKINRINGVKLCIGRVIRAGKLEFNEIVGFEYAASMNDGEGRKLIEDSLNLEPTLGRLLRDGDKRKAFLGYNLGQPDNGFGSKPITTGSTILLQDVAFEVVGINEKQGSFLYDNIVLVNEDDLREIMDIPKDEFDLIVAQVDEKADMKKVREDIEKIMRKERDVKLGEEDFTVESPQQMLNQVNSILFAVQLFVYIIASISIVVGGIGIMNTMFTSVIERTRDIGIMKSIGARNSAIFWLFFIESGLIGMVGGLIGAGLGAGLSYGLAYAGRNALGMDLIQADLGLTLLLGAIFGSFFLGSIFGIIPAVKASWLHPVDALRHKN